MYVGEATGLFHLRISLEYHTRNTHHRHHHHLLLPLSTHDRSLQVQTCYNRLQFVRLAPKASLTFSLGLVQVPGSAAGEAAAAGRAGGRRRWREPGRAAAGALRGAGRPRRPRTARRGPTPRPVADRPPPRSGRSHAHSPCAQRLRVTLPSLGERVLLPGAPGGGVQAFPATRHFAPAPRAGVRLGKVGEVPDAACALPRPSRRPAPGARDALVPGTAGGRRPGSLSPASPTSRRCSAASSVLLQRQRLSASVFLGEPFPRSTSPGVEEERNGRERQEGDALPRLLTCLGFALPD